MAEPQGTPPPPRATPEPRPAPRPDELAPGAQNLVNQIERAIDSGDPFMMIFQLGRFANAAPSEMPSEVWTQLYMGLTEALGRQLGVPTDQAGVSNLPLLEAYRQAFSGAQNLQLRLGAGSTPESMLDDAGEWIGAFNEFMRQLNIRQGTPLASRLHSFTTEMQDSFTTLADTFRAAGLQVEPPTIPPDPSQMDLQPGAGDSGIFGPPGGGGGGFTPSRSVVVEELRPPTAEEFMNDFDNAFVAYLGENLDTLSPMQLATVRERRNELLERYVQRLSEFAQAGESPFLESTRTGEVVSESSTSLVGEGTPGEEVVTKTTRFGVETGTDIGLGFLTAKVTPTAFLTGLFPTPTALKNFAVSPFPERSPVGREGFAPATRFQG